MGTFKIKSKEKIQLPKPLRGIIPPLITPLLVDHTLDTDGLKKLIEHVLDGGVHGIFILGTTGEFSSLSYNLRHKMIKVTCEIVKGRVPVLVGVTDTAFEESLRLAETAFSSNASAVVAAPPFYFTPTSDEITSYYKHLADSIPLPLFLYNIPLFTKISLEPKVIKEVARHPNIIGVKDSSADGGYFQQILFAVQDDPDFTVLMGPEELTAEAILMGAHGGVNGGANMFPKLYVRLYEASIIQDFKKIKELQLQVILIANKLYALGAGSSSYLNGIKSVLSELGICNHYVAEPLKSFDTEAIRVLRKNLKEVREENKKLQIL